MTGRIMKRHSEQGRRSDKASEISLWAGILALCFSPLSISLSQGFLAVALVALLICMRSNPMQKWTADFRRVILLALLLYGSWFCSAALHALMAGSLSPVSAALRTDLKDIWLMGTAIWVYHHGNVSERHRTLLLRGVAAVFFLILATGLISVFTPFRLSRTLYHLQHGLIFSKEARLQHPMFTPLPGITLYMPVGMLGTHLAYGAQLGFFIIPLTLYVLGLWIERPWFRSWHASDLAAALLLGLSLFVLMLNNARSAIFGVLSALLAGLIILTYRRWKRRLWALAPVTVLLISAPAVAMVADENVGEFLMQSIGLEKKHSDYQRVMLWSTTSGLVLEHPVIGVGPGRFSEFVAERMHAIAAESPYLWYLFMQTERGHAHNDLLHNLATAGIPAGLLFLMFWAALLALAAGEEASDRFSGESAMLLDRIMILMRPYLPFMPLLLLFGGVFQCYFLDDQVLMPFWMSVGLAALARKAETTTEKVHV
jgi:O-antigen ligase